MCTYINIEYLDIWHMPTYVKYTNRYQCLFIYLTYAHIHCIFTHIVFWILKYLIHTYIFTQHISIVSQYIHSNLAQASPEPFRF